MNLKDNIARIEQELVEMKKQLGTKTGFWEPVNGEEAWYISSDGIINSSIRSISTTDINSVAQGNIFQTEQEALDEVEYRKAKYILRKEIWRLNGNIYPQWDWLIDVNKYSLCIDGNTGKIVWEGFWHLKLQPSWFYLASEELCKQLVSTHSKELMIYLNR